MESTSKLIFEFIAISDHVVNSLVCGIIFTEKFGSSLSFTWLTVNEIPSRETEPFSTINLLNFFGYFTIYMLLFLSSWISDNSPKQSTWPYTKWPPISSPTFKLFSKFILVPSLQNFVVVLSSVSFDTSTSKKFWLCSSPLLITVKHTPEQDIEAPISIYLLSYEQATLINRWSLSLISIISPISVIIPVNIIFLPYKP